MTPSGSPGSTAAVSAKWTTARWAFLAATSPSTDTPWSTSGCLSRSSGFLIPTKCVAANASYRKRWSLKQATTGGRYANEPIIRKAAALQICADRLGLRHEPGVYRGREAFPGTTYFVSVPKVRSVGSNGLNHCKHYRWGGKTRTRPYCRCRQQTDQC